MKFEWDPVKAYANEGKHGVTFDEATTVFGDVLSVSGRDLEHSVGENRFVTFGLSSQGRVCWWYLTPIAAALFASSVHVLQSERRN